MSFRASSARRDYASIARRIDPHADRWITSEFDSVTPAIPDLSVPETHEDRGTNRFQRSPYSPPVSPVQLIPNRSAYLAVGLGASFVVLCLSSCRMESVVDEFVGRWPNLRTDTGDPDTV